MESWILRVLFKVNVTWSPSGFTYFTRDQKYSWLHEPYTNQIHFLNEASRWDYVLIALASSKEGSDEPAHPHSLARTFQAGIYIQTGLEKSTRPLAMYLMLQDEWKFWLFPIKTRACSRWGAIANSHAKVFYSPSTPQSRGMTLATEWKFCSICFLSFICENTHKVWYKSLWNWHVNDIWPFELAPRSPVWP